MNKNWEELTPEQQLMVRTQYEPMPEGDEPPYPRKGTVGILMGGGSERTIFQTLCGRWRFEERVFIHTCTVAGHLFSTVFPLRPTEMQGVCLPVRRMAVEQYRE